MQIFHPIFDEFIQLAKNPPVNLTKDDIRRARKLMHFLSGISWTEAHRNPDLRAHLEDILQLNIHTEQNTDLTCADGVYSCVVNGIRITLLIMEFKREFGDGSSDPSTQAGLTMRRTWLDERVSLISSFLVLSHFYSYLAKGNPR